MIDLAFWYILFGVLLIVDAQLYIFMPGEVRRMLKGITRRVSTMRLVGFSYVFLAVLMWYSAINSDGMGATILLILSYAVLVKAILIIYIPKWLRKHVVKKIIDRKNYVYQITGVVIFACGIISAIYGALYV